VIDAGIAVWPGFEARLSREAPRLFMFMLLAFAGMTYNGESVAGRLFVALTAWGGIGAGLGFAFRLKPVATLALTYLTEATMPVFIVHHAPLLLLGVLLLPMAVAQDHVDLDSGHGDFASGLSLADPTLATGALVNGNGHQPGDHPQRSCLKVNRASE
jgi:hypothetical protein